MIKYAIRNKLNAFYLVQVEIDGYHGIVVYQEETYDVLHAHLFNAEADALAVLYGKERTKHDPTYPIPLHHTYDPTNYVVVKVKLIAVALE